MLRGPLDSSKAVLLLRRNKHVVGLPLSPRRPTSGYLTCSRFRKNYVGEATTQDPMQFVPPLVVEVAVVEVDGSIVFCRSDGIHTESALGLLLSA